MYLYMYFLKSLYLLEIIVAYIFYFKWILFISIVFLLYLLNIYFFICIFINIYWIGSTFVLSNTCAIKFIEGKFYF